MVIYRTVDEIRSIGGSVVTIGTFDGLHRGHQEIIKHVVTLAQAKGLNSIVITFNPHPRHILNPGPNVLPLLIGIDKKLDLLRELQINIVLIIPFTRDFSLYTAEDFMNNVVTNKFKPEHIVIGYDHHFGFQRKGSPEYLKQYCAKQHCNLDIIEPVSDRGSIISSSHIRELIEAGYVRRASFELGWVYGFRAQVVYGVGRGKTMKFPTANFVPVEENQLLPKNGVYLTRGRVVGHRLYGMCNLGVRPTFGEGEFVMEVHFFGKEIDSLYGQEITIEFLERIRDERKFKSKIDLIKQLETDKQYCQKLLNKYK